MERVKELFLRAFPNRKIDFVEKIPRGYSNESYMVISEGEKFRVRFGRNNEIISRENEKAMLEASGNKDCLFYVGSNGDSIWKWIEGDSLKKEDVNEWLIDELVIILEKLHSIPRGNNSKIINHDDFEFLERFRNNFDGEDLDLYRQLVNKYSGDSRCICHNDVSLGNLIVDVPNKKLHLIDYEWGRINSPYWDYGNFVKEADLPLNHVEYLAERAGLELNKLKEYCFISTSYSLQLSFIFPQNYLLDEFRNRLGIQSSKYRGWLGM